MKRIAMAAVVLLAAALQTMGQSINYNSSKSNTGNSPITCSGPDGKPCNAKHVSDLNEWLGSTTGRRQHQPLAEIKTVTLASPKDGSLGCVQNSGAACTAEQQKALAELYKPAGEGKASKEAVKGEGVDGGQVRPQKKQ